MAPHAGTAGLKVLLAGASQLDLGEAQAFLSGEGAVVTISLSRYETAKLLQTTDFDVAVVEVEGALPAADAADRLQFLTDSYLPTVVALDFQDASSMVKAVELGAVDILQKPISSQTGRLGTLWQHTLRKRNAAATLNGNSESQNTSSGAGSTVAAEPTVCTAGDDLVKAVLPDLFEADIWDEQHTAGTSGEHGSSVDTPETPSISHHLRQDIQDLTSGQSLLSSYHTDFSSVHSGSGLHDHMVKAHSVNSALSPVLVPQRPAALPLIQSERKCSTPLPLNVSIGLQAVSADCDISSYELQPTFSECLDFFEGDPFEDTRQSKKQKVEWTRELHDKFVSAVEALSVDKAVPSKILERMGSCSEGLTRQNIASHLQKYRNRKRSRQSQSFVTPFRGSAHLPPLLPAPALGAWGSTWPSYTSPGQQCASPYACSQAAAAPITPNIALTISEMLTQPQGAPPLGLKLDTAAVLAQMSNTRLIQA